MYLVCSDLEGVFVPEVWINVAQKTGIDELKLTTRDITDYDVLMQKRLSILQEHQLKLKDIQDVIDTIEPLEGALEFLDWLRSKTQLIIVSDTFTEFADPLMKKLKRPTLLCNNLTVDADNRITGYNIRQKDPKRKVVQAFNQLNYNVIACGDSYNDVSMLQEAQEGILFSPPDKVVEDYPELPVTRNYRELKNRIEPYL
jgi:phosphoserine/homoserine phosphotransferase